MGGRGGVEVVSVKRGGKLYSNFGLENQGGGDLGHMGGVLAVRKKFLKLNPLSVATSRGRETPGEYPLKT